MPVRILIQEDANNGSLLAKLRLVPSRMEQEILDEANRISVDILRDSKTVTPRVPLDTGALQSTGHVEPARIQGHNITGGVSYGGTAESGVRVDYAVLVHENMNARFKRPGSGPKFLEAHFRRRGDEISDRLWAAGQRGAQS